MSTINRRLTSDNIPQASIYARMSLDRTGEGLGIERQLESCREFCRHMGWAVREEFFDNDISATTGKRRPRFEALLSSAPEVIVVFHTDRLVRVTRDLERVIEMGVNIHAVTAGNLDLSNPAGRAVARTVTAWATYEGEQKAIRQKLASGQRAKAGKPWWVRVPFGFNADGTLVESEAAALRKAYEAVNSGVAIQHAASELNAGGFRSRLSKPWTGPALRAVLISPRNAGIREYLGEEVGKGNWEPIITEELYRSLVQVLSRPARNVGGEGPTPTTLLTRIAMCGKCDGSVLGAFSRGRRGDAQAYPTYVCRVGKCVSHPRGMVDAFVEEAAIQMLASDVATQVWTSTTGVAVDELRQEVISLRQKLDFLAEDYTSDLITRAQLVSASSKIKEKLALAESALAQTAKGSAIVGLHGTEAEVRRKWEALSLGRKRAALAALFPGVRLLQRGKGVRWTPEAVRLPNDRQAA